MTTWIWSKIWGTGHLVCPVCFHGLHDHEPQAEGVLWLCHHCELEIDDMDTAYSWYWPFDILWPRFQWWAWTLTRRDND